MDPEAFRREATASSTGSPTTSTIPDAIRSSRSVRPGDIRDALPGARARARRAVRRDLRRLRARDRARPHALEPSRLLRLLRDHRQRARRPRRVPVGGAQRQQAMLWRTSPAATELEEVALGWLRQLIGLPDAFEGVIYDTASISTLHALAAAREAAVAGRPRARARRPRRSAARPRLLLRAGALVDRQGGDPARPRPRRAATDSGRRASSACGPTRWRDAIAEDRAARHRCRSPSSPRSARTSTHERRSGRRRSPTICARERVWLHVDAAYAGVAAMVPGLRMDPARRRARRLARRQSAQVAVHAVRSRACSTAGAWTSCAQAFSLTPEYLQDERRTAGVKNLMDTGIQLGRRFRALKLWMVLRHFGAEGLRDAARRAHAARARCSRHGSTRAIASSASRRCPSASSASGCGTTRLMNGTRGSSIE